MIRILSISKGAGEAERFLRRFCLLKGGYEIMKIRKVLSITMAGVMMMGMLGGCSSSSDEGTASEESTGSSDEAASSGDDENVLRVGMECAYAPFNWTQDSATTPDGSEAEPIYGSDYYAYGYDVAVAQMLAEELGMDLEIHKVEWSSIGISMDSGEYDCIIAGMGRTAEREMAYSFTEPYYYRDNCIVVKKGGKYEDVTKLSDLAGTGCVVTTQLGTGWVPLLDQIEGAQTGSNYETTSECFMAVSNGVADVCIVDVPTAESALLTNDDLKIIQFDESDTFTGDDEMVNVCIATRKDDTALRDKLQEAMDSLGWNDKAKMDELMETVLTQQPAAE
jgi:putative lysine transport system substrate-binding protein